MMRSFAEYTTPLSPEEFLADYRGTQPAYFTGDPDRYEFLFDSESMGEVLSRLVVSSGILRMRGPDGAIPESEILSTRLDADRERRAVDTRAVERRLAEGATLIVSHCESMFPSVDAMARQLSEVFLARVTGTLFLVYEPDRPCGLHWDDRDMFVCQVAGRKRWPVYTPFYECPLFDPGRSATPVPPSSTCQEYILGPGDGLYIPRGWAHNPSGVEGLSLHVAFAIATPTGADLLDWIKTDLLDRSADVRADLPLGQPADGVRTYAAKLRAAVLERLSDQAIHGYCQRHTLSAYRRPLKVRDFQRKTAGVAE